MKVITPAEREEFNDRFDKIENQIPRNYVSVIEFLRPGKYSKNELRDFRNRKTVNFDILKDFEEIILTINPWLNL